MKYYLLCFAIMLISSISNVKSQDFGKIKDVVLTDSLSCVQAETTVLECCNYLLNSPYKQELNSLYARDFITQWMTKTSNYSFTTLNEKFFKILQDDVLLSSRYFAAMSKVVIENKYAISESDMQLQAITIFLNYCKPSKNKVPISKKLQKYIDALDSNTLAEFIKS